MSSVTIPKLRPASADAAPCKICGSQSVLYGVVDFNRGCQTPHSTKLPLLGIPIYYRRCVHCGFIFTNSFDNWQEPEFKEYIYNDRYIELDPDYAEVRPTSSAKLVESLFRNDKSRLRLLDYGGGNGLCAQLLSTAGFTAEIYDPFTPGYGCRPQGKFEVVLCFETLEHLPNPMEGIKSMVERTSDIGIVLFSTLVQPADFERHGINWWYIGPRNGHVSIFSRNSLNLAWQHFGFRVASFNDDLHLAFRRIPEFAKHFVKSEVARRQ